MDWIISKTLVSSFGYGICLGGLTEERSSLFVSSTFAASIVGMEEFVLRLCAREEFVGIVEFIGAIGVGVLDIRPTDPGALLSPTAFVSMAEIFNAPGVPAVNVIVLVFAGPVIVPPVILHEYVIPALGVTEAV